MKKTTIVVPGMPSEFVSQDDEGMFAFINTLRVSVKARVATEQERGASLSDIVVQVREMVRLAEGDVENSRAFPSHAFRAITRQAVAWCVETYRPGGFTAVADGSADPDASDTGPLHLTPLSRASHAAAPLPLPINEEKR